MLMEAGWLTLERYGHQDNYSLWNLMLLYQPRAVLGQAPSGGICMTCIHLGLHKAASSTLKYSLFSAHSQIEYLGRGKYGPRPTVPSRRSLSSPVKMAARSSLPAPRQFSPGIPSKYTSAIISLIPLLPGLALVSLTLLRTAAVCNLKIYQFHPAVVWSGPVTLFNVSWTLNAQANW